MVHWIQVDGANIFQYLNSMQWFAFESEINYCWTLESVRWAPRVCGCTPVVTLLTIWRRLDYNSPGTHCFWRTINVSSNSPLDYWGGIGRQPQLLRKHVPEPPYTESTLMIKWFADRPTLYFFCSPTPYFFQNETIYIWWASGGECRVLPRRMIPFKGLFLFARAKRDMTIRCRQFVAKYYINFILKNPASIWQ